MHFNVVRNLSSLERRLWPKALTRSTRGDTAAQALSSQRRSSQPRGAKGSLGEPRVPLTRLPHREEQRPFGPGSRCLHSFALAASDGTATPRNLSFTTLLNSLSLHLITMNPDLWPPCHIITFLKPALKIKIPDFYLPPPSESEFKRLKSLASSA